MVLNDERFSGGWIKRFSFARACLKCSEAIAARQEIIDIVFGVVLFTLLVQGLTIQGLLKSLNLIGDQPLRQEYSQLIARQIALQRVLNYLENPERFPDIKPEFYRYK